MQIFRFGSYADGGTTYGSDLDLLVEFESAAVSLLTLADIKYRLEDEFGVPVDVIHAPLPANSLFKAEKPVLM